MDSERGCILVVALSIVVIIALVILVATLGAL